MVHRGGILIALWSLLAMPALCIAGVLGHPCDCGGTADCADATGCSHGDTCPHDPCHRVVLARSDEHSHEAQLAVSMAQPLILLGVDATCSTHALTRSAVAPAEAGYLLALPFPQSEIPLLI